MRSLALISCALIAACSAEIRTIDLKGAKDATVFLVHTVGEEEPEVVRVDGPFLLDSDGRLESREQPAFFDQTEALIISHDALETYTAGRDDSPKGRLRFRRTAPCFVDRQCKFELRISRPTSELIAQTEDAQSLGHLIGELPASLLVGEPPDWLGQVTLHAPFDLELIEQQRLEPFGQVEEWATALDDYGVRDYYPVRSDQVVVASAKQICLVDETMGVEEICAPGPRRISIDEIEGEIATGNFRRLAAQRDGGGKMYALVHNATFSNIVRFDVAATALENFETVTTVSSTTGDVELREIAVSDDGTTVVTIETNPENEFGFLEILKIALDDTIERRIIRNNGPGTFADSEIRGAQLVSTNSPTYPLVSGTRNAFQLFDVEADTWRHSFFQREFSNSLSVKGLALREDAGATTVVTAHRNGTLFRHTLPPSVDSQQVPLIMPQPYVKDCDFAVQSNEGRMVADIRFLHVRGPHDAFIVGDSCEILFWLDPDPANASLPHVSIFIDGSVGQPWPVRDGDALPRHTIRSVGDDVWLGGGRTLKKINVPRLCPNCN